MIFVSFLKDLLAGSSFSWRRRLCHSLVRFFYGNMLTGVSIGLCPHRPKLEVVIRLVGTPTDRGSFLLTDSVAT